MVFQAGTGANPIKTPTPVSVHRQLVVVNFWPTLGRREWQHVKSGGLETPS